MCRPEELFPVQWIGTMILNANPSNHHAEVEQVAYCTSNIIPGIDFSNDPLLQGRNFSYLDTQMSRLGGPNFIELPINRPVSGCPFFNNQRAGMHRHTINSSKVNYYPNRFSSPIPVQSTPSDSKNAGGFESYHEKINGIKQRLKSPRFGDHYSQVCDWYNIIYCIVCCIYIYIYIYIHSNHINIIHCITVNQHRHNYFIIA